MLLRLALVLVCGLALAAPSLADDPPGPAPIGGHTPPFVWTVPDLPQPRWKVVAGALTTRGAWPTDRVYYARTLADIERWSANVSKKDQAVARNLNYSRYGLLALFVTSRDNFTIDGVYWHGNGFLRVQVRTPDPYAECRGATFPLPSVCVMPRPPALSFPQYRLIAIRKDSLPSPVKRLYITEVADPSPVVIHDPPPPPPTSSQVTVPPSATPSDVTPLPQADWRLVAGSFTWKPESRNRIFYARTPGQVSAWKYHVFDTYETRAALHQNFSRYGLLAIFMAKWQPGSSIAGIYLVGDGALNVHFRAAPPLEPPDCPSAPPGGPDAPCPVSVAAPVPQYSLIAIRKGSLPAPVKRLYITEVS